MKKSYLASITLALWSTLAHATQLQDTPCPPEVQLAIPATCHTMNVPQHHGSTQQDTYPIFVVVIQGPHPERLPTVLLNGGPGGSFLDEHLHLFQNPSPGSVGAWLLEQGPVVMFDQRGGGLSGPDTSCQTTSTAGCLEETRQWDASTFTTQEISEDLASLQDALQVPQINLYGVSYGTHLALHYIRLHPERTQWAALRGVDPFERDLQIDSILHLADTTSRIEQLCQQDPECQAEHPDFHVDLDALHAQYQKNPQTLTLDGETFTVNGDDVLAALQFNLTFPAGAAMLPRVYAELTQGNLEPLIYDLTPEPPSLMFLAVTCQMMRSHRPPALTGRPMQDALILRHQKDLATCENIGLGDPAPPTQKAGKQPRVLLISGELDPITPPRYGELALKSLERAQHVVFPYATHSFLFQPKLEGCLVKVLDRFVQQPESPALDACLNQLTRVKFIRKSR